MAGAMASEGIRRHQLTREERQKGFRNAVFSIQNKHGLDFNQAVQWLLRNGRGLRWNNNQMEVKT